MLRFVVFFSVLFRSLCVDGDNFDVITQIAEMNQNLTNCYSTAKLIRKILPATVERKFALKSTADFSEFSE